MHGRFASNQSIRHETKKILEVKITKGENIDATFSSNHKMSKAKFKTA